MRHAGPAEKGRKDAAGSEIWERQERGARAGRREHVRSGVQRWEPQYQARFGLWESQGYPVLFPEQIEGVGTTAQAAVSPPTPSLMDWGIPARVWLEHH